LSKPEHRFPAALLLEPRRTFVALLFLHRSPDIVMAQGTAERAHGTIQMCHLLINGGRRMLTAIA